MDVRFFIILFTIAPRYSYFLGEISENVTFLHSKFRGPPSRRAEIWFRVSFKEQGHHPIFGIYTTEDHINIQKQCTYIDYGQLGNRNLHLRLTTDDYVYPYLHDSDFCVPVLASVNDSRSISCQRFITVQDFIPRNFYFSFGFRCDEMSSSLQGLDYFITFDGTNEIRCSALPPSSLCRQYYNYTIFPNLFGEDNIHTISHHFAKYDRFRSNFTSEGYCNQYLLQFSCYLFVPKCDPVIASNGRIYKDASTDRTYKSEKISVLCREMCQDFLNECGMNLFDVASIDCDYLPSLHGDIPCINTCQDPPVVENAFILTNSSIHFPHDTVQYSCSDAFQFEGNDSIECLYNGEWSNPPRCKIRSIVVVLILLFVLFPAIVVFTIKLASVRKPGLALSTHNLPKLRNREFDAFILYQFDTDNDFVVDNILPQLEETRDYKLHVHSRDFTPGRDIEENIEEAIENSNSAIIVMSQGFVDSMWCKEEFTHCYIENMKDAAFNLFVIMMQPADTLVNITLNMKTFFHTKTYLQKDDPDLSIKLATLLENTRKPENDDADNGKMEDDKIDAADENDGDHDDDDDDDNNVDDDDEMGEIIWNKQEVFWNYDETLVMQETTV